MRADPNDSKVTRTMMGLGVPEEVARAKTRATPSRSTSVKAFTSPAGRWIPRA